MRFAIALTVARPVAAVISCAGLMLATSPGHANAMEYPLPPGAHVVSGAPQWVKVDSRLITSQLLKQTFDLTDLKGRFKAFRIEADSGTVEIARSEVTFEAEEPAIDNRFSILQPKSGTHKIALGEDKAVRKVAFIANTARKRSHIGRMTLYALHLPDIVIPPPPQRAFAPPIEAASAATPR